MLFLKLTNEGCKSLCDSEQEEEKNMIKKIRDLTKSEFLSWRANNCRNCANCIFRGTGCSEESSFLENMEKYSNIFLNQEINVEPLLTESEKSWLKSFLEPFKDTIIYIRKSHFSIKEKDKQVLTIFYDAFSTTTPYFKINTMFKNLEVGISYTLEDLEVYYENEGN